MLDDGFEILKEDDLVCSDEIITEQSGIQYFVVTKKDNDYRMWKLVKRLLRMMFSAETFDEPIAELMNYNSEKFIQREIRFKRKLHIMEWCWFLRRMKMFYAEKFNYDQKVWVFRKMNHLRFGVRFGSDNNDADTEYKNIYDLVKEPQFYTDYFMFCFNDHWDYFYNDLFDSASYGIINLDVIEKMKKYTGEDEIEHHGCSWIKTLRRPKKENYHAFTRVMGDWLIIKVELNKEEKKMLRRRLVTNVYGKHFGIFKFPKTIWRNNVPHLGLLLIKYDA